MNSQEALVRLINLKHVEDDLRVLYNNNLSPNDVGSCNGDAKALYSYILDTCDKKMAIECCKIDRSLFYRFVPADTVGKKLFSCVRTLFEIHNWVLENVYDISDEDRKECRYFIDGKYGKIYKVEEERCPQICEALQELEDEDAVKAKTDATKVEKSFRRIIQYQDKEELLERLHTLIDGKRGADVGSVLLAAMQEKYLTRRPTQKEFESEFSLIGSWSAISNYLDAENDNALLRASKIKIL